jgi:hypothetical protein
LEHSELGGWRQLRRSAWSSQLKRVAFKASLTIGGALAGEVTWGIAAFLLLLVYWIGYEIVYLGLLCGTGKLGLGWLTPPGPANQEMISSGAMFFTAFAFTWGLALAALIGSALALRTGTIWTRRFSLVRRIVAALRGMGGQNGSAVNSHGKSD